MSILNILGLYTSKQYNELKDISNSNANQCEKLNQELQQTRTEIATSHQEITKLQAKTEELEKQNDTLVKRNAELSGKLNVKEEVINEWYYMYNSFEDMFYTEDGVRYINAMSDGMLKNNSLRAVYNHIWANDSNHKVTFKEFNDEFTKLYNNRNSELVDDYLRNQLIQVKYFTTSVEQDHAYNYAYNDNGVLCYKTGMRPLYK